MKDNKKVFFHFTHKENLESILEKGLVQRIGSNAMTAEDSPKIFFSEGKEYALKCIDVWLRWNIVRVSRDLMISRAVSNINPAVNIQAAEYYSAEYQKAKDAHLDRVISTELLNEKLLKDLSFEMVYQEWKKSIYLALDLEENTHFRYDDTDDGKERHRGNVRETKYMQFMYGGYESEGLEKWNMHTLRELPSIPPERIQQVDYQGKTDALTVAKKMYMDKKEYVDNRLPLLAEWFEFCKERDLQQNNSKPNALTEFLNEYQRRQQENPHYKLEEFDRWLDYMGIESNNVLSKKIPQTENAVN